MEINVVSLLYSLEIYLSLYSAYILSVNKETLLSKSLL